MDSYNAGELVLNNVVVNDNTSETTGGGIANAGKLTVEDDGTLTVTGNSSTVKGGGIYNTSTGTAILTNTTIESNASFDGAGIANEGNITLETSSVIQKNTTSDFGGGMYNFTNGVATINGQVIENSAVKGAGIFNTDAATLMVTGKILRNDGTSHGGGFYVENGTVNLNNAEVTENDANVGGGMYANGGSITITNTFIKANTANNGGGIEITNKGNVKVIGGEISMHDTPNDGAAIRNAGNLVIINTTLLQNKANNGAGLFVTGNGTSVIQGAIFKDNLATNGAGIFNRGDMNVTSSDFQNNQAKNQGGGIFNGTKGDKVTTSCFVGNIASQGGGVFSGFDLSAINNYWGSDSGPSGDGLGIGDSINKNVLYTPFSTTRCTPIEISIPIIPTQSATSTPETSTPSATPTLETPTLSVTSTLETPTPSDTPTLETPTLTLPTTTFTPTSTPTPTSTATDTFTATSTPISTATATSTATPQPPTEQTLTIHSQPANDGWIWRNQKNRATTNKLSTAIQVSTTTNGQQYRSILSFDTSSLPDDAVITSVVLNLTSARNTTVNSLVVDIKDGCFNGSCALTVQDYNAAASQSKAGIFTAISGSNSYVAEIGSSALSFINPKGITQFRIRLELPISQKLNQILTFYSGNWQTANQQPVIEVKYYIP